jgi:hypothetical protein
MRECLATNEYVADRAGHGRAGTGGDMDLSKFKTSDWLKIGGAAGFLIFGFLDWVKVSVSGFGSATGGNVFDFFFTGTVPWLLTMAVGVLTFLLAAQLIKADNVPWTLIFLAAMALAALLIVIRLIIGPADDAAGVDVSRGIGLWLSTIAVLVAFAGAILGFRESGGEFSDLTDMNKLKGAFNTGGTATDAPPPPPAPPTAPPAPPSNPPAAPPAPPAPPAGSDVPPTAGDAPPPPPPPPSS